MANIRSWSTMTDKQKLDTGIWIVVSTMAVVISSFCTIIVTMNNEYKKAQADGQAKAEKRAEYYENKYISSLEEFKKTSTRLEHLADTLKLQVDEKK